MLCCLYAALFTQSNLQILFCFVFQWVANPANDMYADTVTTVILEVQSNPKIQKGISLMYAYLTEAFLPIILHQA